MIYTIEKNEIINKKNSKNHIKMQKIVIIK